MKRFGLIGNPISHSKSPALFKAGYGGKYTYDLIESEDFEEAYERFLSGYDGINVTAPFKEMAFKRADILTESVRKTRAANLLLKTGDGIKAYNSDVDGVRLAVEEAYCPARHGKRKALVVGCGGAGRAALLAAARMGCETAVMNRSAGKAAEAARAFEEFGTVALPLSDFRKAFRDSNLIIYTIPCPIDGFDSLSEEDFAGGKIVLEANYKNPTMKDRFSSLIEKHGGKYVSGKKWLLYQALAGYEIFTGERPDMAEMEKQLI